LWISCEFVAQQISTKSRHNKINGIWDHVKTLWVRCDKLLYDNFTTNPRQIHNKSNQWSVSIIVVYNTMQDEHTEVLTASIAIGTVSLSGEKQ